MKKYCLFLMLFLTSILGFAAPLPAEAVFHITARTLDPNTFVLDWTIKDGYFLYQNSIKLVSPQQSNFRISRTIFPLPLKKTDTSARVYDIYRHQLILPVAILGEQPGEGLLQVHFQGCADEGFCYPPQQTEIKLTIDPNLALTHINVEIPAQKSLPDTKKMHQGERLERLFSTNNWLLITLSFFSFGLLLAFTPCVLPMIPVLSGIIIGHGSNLSTRKAFLLSLSYVLSMSLTYSVIGAFIALMGNNLQAAMQSSWAIGFFSLLFVVLALAMFNVYELRLPIGLQNKIASLTRSRSGGHYLSAAIMGSLSILILSPCVTAPLIGALTYIANQGNIGLGILALFFLGLGMGTPLLLIGTSAGKLLPKAGPWMNEVRAFFGVLLLAVAIYLSSRLLPSVLTMGLWACLLIFSSIYLGALKRANTTLEKFNQGVGLILLVYGFLILIGASQDHTNPLLPLKQTINNTQENVSQKIATTVDEAQKVLTNALTDGKPVMVDFYADWCESCKIMARTTLRDPRVTALLNNMVVLNVDLTPNDAQTHALLAFFNVVAPPTFLFFDAKGQALDKLQLVGEVSADIFVETLKQV